MPEPLVTIRYYDTPEEARRDQRILGRAGITVYVGGGPRGGMRFRMPAGEIRVPESQAERALSLLPPQPPNLLAPPEVPSVCPWCGSDRARYAGAVARILGFLGIFTAASLTVRRHFELAALVGCCTVFAIWRANIGGDLVCANCGRQWRPPRAAPEPEPEAEPRSVNQPEE